jgi:hypothetical protein
MIRNVFDNTRKMNNVEKIRILYNKWHRIQNDEREDGMKYNDIIQRLAISITYEEKDFDLMYNITRKADFKENNIFYKVILTLSKNRPSKTESQFQKRVGKY